MRWCSISRILLPCTTARRPGYDSLPGLDLYREQLSVWVKLVRTGNTFVGFVSADGVNWTQAGTPTTVVMASNVYIGLALCSQGGTDTATFDNVLTTVGTTPYIASVSPQVAGTGTAVAITGSNFGSPQGSSTLKFNGVLATSVSSWTSSQIVATVPSTVPAGTGNR